MKVLLIPILIAGTFLQTAALRSPQQEPVADTRIAFRITNAGFDVAGTIACNSADIIFNPDDLAGSSIQATAAVSTIHTGIAMRDRHLQKADYFDASRYPDIILKSVNFTRRSRNKYTGIFALTIKHTAQRVEIELTTENRNGERILKGRCAINRLDFGLGEKSPVLSETVSVWLEARY